MRDHIQAIESAAAIQDLGRLADRAALIALRAREAKYTDADLQVLVEARHVLEAVLDFSGRTLPRARSLQLMKADLLDETFDAVAIATARPEDAIPVVRRLVASLKALSKGEESAEDRTEVAQFFDRLSEWTLARGAELARPGKERYQRWVARAQNS